jgi:hypothetical protein
MAAFQHAAAPEFNHRHRWHPSSFRDLRDFLRMGVLQIVPFRVSMKYRGKRPRATGKDRCNAALAGDEAMRLGG